MTIEHIPFKQLNIDQLYDILQFRIDIYVVEQGWRYQDLDNIDKHSHHVTLKQDNEIIGVSRLYEMEGSAWIGRMLVNKQFRRQKFGTQLMEYNINACQQLFPDQDIRLLSPLSIKQFYENHQFQISGDIFHDEGVPYVEMTRDNHTI